MKKLLLAGAIFTSIFAQNLKTNDVFIGLSAGRTTTNSDHKTYGEFKIGKYFYDKNIYNISNRIYISGLATTSSEKQFGIAKANLDWIWTTIPYLKPFIGVDAGYLYYKDDSSKSTGVYGFKLGALIYLGDTLELEAGINVDKATQNSDFWTSNLKKVYGGINFSF